MDFTKICDFSIKTENVRQKEKEREPADAADSRADCVCQSTEEPERGPALENVAARPSSAADRNPFFLSPDGPPCLLPDASFYPDNRLPSGSGAENIPSDRGKATETEKNNPWNRNLLPGIRKMRKKDSDTIHPAEESISIPQTPDSPGLHFL